MQRLEQLARAAVGFDAARGDQVVIENVSFSSNAPEAAPVGMAKVMDETDAAAACAAGSAEDAVLRCAGFAAGADGGEADVAAHDDGAEPERRRWRCRRRAERRTGAGWRERERLAPGSAGAASFVLPKRPTRHAGDL